MTSRIPLQPITDAPSVAWLAGLLEGEGSFVLCANRIAISLAMTDKDTIDKVCALTGARSYPVTSRAAHHKQAYVCKITGQRAQYYMQCILPYMGLRRSEKIQECLSHFDMALSARRERIAALGRVVTDSALQSAWLERDPSMSFRAFARALGVASRTKLQQRLIRLGLIPPTSDVDLPQQADEQPALEGKEATAWLAGLLDGEGCFMWSKNSPIISLQMADEDIVARFCRLTFSRYRAASRPASKHKTMFTAVISGQPAIELMIRVQPWMSVRRASRIAEIRTKYLAHLSHQAVQQAARRAHLPIAEFQDRWLRKQPHESLLSISREFGVHPESLKRQLVRLGIYALQPISSSSEPRPAM